MNHVVDIDFNNHASWKGILTAILALCGEAADLSFDGRVSDSCRVPTVEFRLDRPEELELPQITVQGGQRIETWKNGTVILADALPERVPDGNVWLLRKNGAAATTYRAFCETVRVLKLFSFQIVFAWGSIPLAPMCDDAALTAERERACCCLGAVHTLWIRCPSDDEVCQTLKTISGCGQIRLQNMATANTWIRGTVDNQGLMEALQLS